MILRLNGYERSNLDYIGLVERREIEEFAQTPLFSIGAISSRLISFLGDWGPGDDVGVVPGHEHIFIPLFHGSQIKESSVQWIIVITLVIDVNVHHILLKIHQKGEN